MAFSLQKPDKVPFVLLVCTLLSCMVAFINKYPLVYSDTGTYIDSGFQGFVPKDRPIFYGLFIRHISLASSLWYVVIAQGFLASWLLRLSLGIFFSGFKRDLLLMLSIGFLCCFTSYSHTVSILIPDLFTPLAILCILVLTLHNNLSRFTHFAVALLFLFCLCAQTSTLMSISILLPVLLVVLYLKRNHPEYSGYFRKAAKVGLYLALAFLLIPTLNYAFGKRFQFGTNSHIFIMGHMVESGVLEPYLKEHCAEKNWKLCRYQDSLVWDFIWNPASPVYKTGGWEANRKEYSSIIQDILLTPKYSTLLFQKSLEGTLKQYFTYEVTAYGAHVSNIAPLDQIKWHYPHALREYFASKQNNNQYKTDVVNAIQLFLMPFCMLALYLFCSARCLRQRLPAALRISLLFFLLYTVINAFVTSTFSTVDPRFQNRLAWLFPFWLMVCIAYVLKDKKQSCMSELLRP